MNSINYLFVKYQKPLVKGLNHWALGTPFRKLLGIKKEFKGKIYKLTDNSYHTRLGKNKFQATFRGYPVFAKRIGVALSKWDSVKDYITGNPNLYKGLDEFKGLLAELGLLDTREFPIVMAASGDPIYSDAGDGTLTVFAHTSWVNARNDTIADTYYSTASQPTIYADYAGGGTPYNLARLILPFDLSSISGDLVSSVLTTYTTANANNANSYGGVLVGATPGDPENIVTDDYDQIGSKDSPTELADRSVYADWDSSGDSHAWTMNGDGETVVENAFGSFVALGIRTTSDVDNSAPTGLNRYTIACSEYADVDKDPKLVVTYTSAGGGANAGWKSLLGVGL